MPGPRLPQRLRRRWGRPALSFVLASPGGPEAAQAAIRSCLNQSLRQVEVIVAAGGAAGGHALSGPAREAVEALATRDSRVRVIDGGAGSALGAARSRWALLMRGEDRIEHDGPAALIDSLKRSGSDLAVGASRVLDGDWRAEPLGPAGRGLRLDEALGVLEAPAPGRLVARTSAWCRLAAGGALGDSQDSADAVLGLLLAARRIDVVNALVRSRTAMGPLSRERRLERLARTADHLPALLSAAAGPVRERVLGSVLRDRLLPLALLAATAGDEGARRLRALAVRLVPSAADPAWATLPLLDRVLLWVLAHGPLDEFWEALASRAEDTTSLPLVPDARAGLAAAAPVLGRLTALPAELLAVRPIDLRVEARATTLAWRDASTLVIEGWARVPGLDPALAGRPRIALVGESASEGGATPAKHGPPAPSAVEVEPRSAPEADEAAQDPWRGYGAAGFRATVTLGAPPGTGAPLRVALSAGAQELSDHLAAPIWMSGAVGSGLSAAWRGEDGRLRVGAALAAPGGGPSALGEAPGAARIGRAWAEGERLWLEGPGGDWVEESSARLILTSSQGAAEAAMGTSGPLWRASIPLNDPGIARGAYRLRWALPSGAFTDCAPAAGLAPVVDVAGRSRGARLAIETGRVSLSLLAPLAPGERTRRGRRLLIEEDAGPLVDGVLLESFQGRSGEDSPGAIAADLARRGLGAPLWFSVVDGTVPAPPGTIPVVRGGQEWFRALRAARVIITNDCLPIWWVKRPGQRVLQTWHGTPIKRLGHDAAPGATSLTYLRMIASQAPQWDLLLAQTPAAEERLRSALGFAGPTWVGEYPRNAPLTAGERPRAEIRRRTRAELDIADDAPVVLLAPTWREGLREGEAPITRIADAASIAGETGAVVLVRGHHMNRLALAAPDGRPGAPTGVIDVSGHPRAEALMLAADVLVTDYSSIIMDFALTGRPAIVHVPDLEDYRRRQGLYGRWPDDAPWPVTHDDAELIAELCRALAAPPSPGGSPAAVAVEGSGPDPVERTLAHLRAWVAQSLGHLP
ncbi:CDP-glycerol glycerophosphotransferase family protein [Actinomyces sp. zg296]|uniref:CDP-glycerol glycerophosphotransferase family protein n=1 Tax=Actinomyces sp. zg296 TaxID=2609289 RepID=UPI0013588763|nr:CDP-glycerol glycerophosphotransferase family protein [Actinomyces sp. zg296]